MDNQGTNNTDNNSDQQSVKESQQFFQPSAYQGPVIMDNSTGATGVQPESSDNSTTDQNKPSKNSNKKLMVVVIIAVLFLLSLTILVIIVGSSSQKTPSKTTQNTVTPTNTSIDPATSLGIEQISNSINQDITGQNDDNDFPPTELDDKALEL